MVNVDDNTRRRVLGEALFNELRVIRGYLEYLAPIKQDLVSIDGHLKEIQSDMHEIRALLRIDDHQAIIQKAYATRMEGSW